MWRFVSFEDLIIIIRSVVISSLLVYGLSLVWDRICMGEAVYLLDMTFCIIFCGGIRLRSRNYREVYLAGDDSSHRRMILARSTGNPADFKGHPGRSPGPIIPWSPWWTPTTLGHSDGLRNSDVPVMTARMFETGKKDR